MKFGNLPISRQGRHQKSQSLLNDEDVSFRIADWLREASKVNRTLEKLTAWINEILLPELSGYGECEGQVC